MFNLRKRLIFLAIAAFVAISHNLIHEATHFLVARLLEEPVEAFRFLTNGWLTSAVIFATPVAERSGAAWLAIAWLPAVITTLLGYVLYAGHRRWLTGRTLLNATLWFAAVFFLCLDPFYFGVLSFFLPGSDPFAAQAMGWPVWPVQLVGLGVLFFNGILAWRLKRFANAHSGRYWPLAPTDDRVPIASAPE